MAIYKNDNGTWYVMIRYQDWTGARKQKCKRGFSTRKEAADWELQFKLQKKASVDMTMESFCTMYEEDVRPSLKQSTWFTKENIIQKKILPYLGKRKVSEITAKDVMDWHNQMRKLKTKTGKPLSPTYLKTIHGQLSTIFNHAVKYYDLSTNPARKAGALGEEEGKEMLFWTKEEYKRFAEEMMDKPLSYYAFQLLYWCGIRSGELLALTPADFNFKKKTLRINKSYQRLKGEDVISTPKTKNSVRTVIMPQFLCDEMQDCLKLYYSLKPDDRIFPVTKYYLNHEMERGCKASGVKKIRVHDLRHSHVSLLINMGNLLHQYALKNKEVSKIEVAHKERRIHVTYSCKNDLWYEFDLRNRGLAARSLYIPKKNMVISGLKEEIGVKNFGGIYIQSNTELCEYLIKVIGAFQSEDTEENKILLEVFLSYVFDNKVLEVAYKQDVNTSNMFKQLLEERFVRVSNELIEKMWAKIDTQEFVNKILTKNYTLYSIDNWSRKNDSI